jgi:hypothetical protein
MVHVSKWRKKPVEIEACKFVYSEEGIKALQEFCGAALGRVSKERHITAVGEAEIGTLEDGVHLTVKHIATEGDYIIKGVQGEFYACKPDIFLQTYEQVEANEAQSFLDALIRDYTTRTVWDRDYEDFLGVYNTIKHFPVVKESDGQFTGGVYSITYDAAKFTYECIFEGNDELPFEIIRRPK